MIVFNLKKKKYFLDKFQKLKIKNLEQLHQSIHNLNFLNKIC